jgi:hypothetical protein
MVKLFILLLCAFIFSAYSVEERIGTDVLSSYEVTDLLEIQPSEGRVIYVDGELFTNEPWSDFEIALPKLEEAVFLTMFDLINSTRTSAGLPTISKTTFKGYVKTKYESL